MIETKKRSLGKSITWRIICIVVSIITAYFLTGKIDVSVAIGTIYNGITMMLYYLHERFWNKLEWENKESNRSKVLQLKSMYILLWLLFVMAIFE